MPRSSLYFLGVCLPNENEPNLSLELGVLRWSLRRRNRLEVYIHSYLRPQSMARVRWANVAAMGIDRRKIEDNPRLPTMDDMYQADFLKGKRVICFSALNEPWHQLTRGAAEVISLASVWRQFFKDNEEASACVTLQQMTAYLGIAEEGAVEHNYTPLLTRIAAMAAVWSVLDAWGAEGVLSPPAAEICAPFWPLPPKSLQLFENSPASFEDLSREQLEDLFKSNLSLVMDWSSLGIYTYDWVFRREKRQVTPDLVGYRELADFIFNRLLSFSVRLWMLIFYSVYEHKPNYALEIALNGGRFDTLSSAIKDHFTLFVIGHLDDFLTDAQKSRLLSSLIRQSLQNCSRESYTHFDYDSLRKHHAEDYYFREEGPEGTDYKCFREIRDPMQDILYRRYAIYGHGYDRELCVDYVNRALREFLLEVKNPLSHYWYTRPLQQWIYFITGVEWADYVRAPKMSEDPHLLECRRKLSAVMEKENRYFIQGLYDKLIRVINRLNESSYDMSPERFTFQGISIEILSSRRPRRGLLKRLLSLS